MKKVLLILIAAMLFIGCTKEDKFNCYECDFGSGWKDAGCMTKSQLETVTFTDDYGNQINKSRCRKK